MGIKQECFMKSVPEFRNERPYVTEKLILIRANNILYALYASVSESLWYSNHINGYPYHQIHARIGAGYSASSTRVGYAWVVLITVVVFGVRLAGWSGDGYLIGCRQQLKTCINWSIPKHVGAYLFDFSFTVYEWISGCFYRGYSLTVITIVLYNT